MKNIQKIGFVFTLITLTSVGCSRFLSPKVLSDVPSILDNPISGKEVTLRGRIVGKIEECHIFTDGSNKILIHFEDEELSYNPEIKYLGKINCVLLESKGGRESRGSRGREMIITIVH